MRSLVHSESLSAEKIFGAVLTVTGWIFAWLLIKCLEGLSKIDEDCFI